LPENVENAMGKVRQRPDGVYFLDYIHNGKRYREKVGRSKKLADQLLSVREAEVLKGEFGLGNKDHNLNSLFSDFLKYSKTNHSPATQSRYRAIIANLEAFLSQYPYLNKISQLSPKTFDDYKTFRKEQGTSNKTVNIELQTFRAMFNLAMDWGYVKENPTKGVRTMKEDNNKKPRFLSKEECRILLNNCGEELYPVFYTFLYTGMRKAELENLEWDDIDFERRKIKIRVKDTWRPKTTEREIPINGDLLVLLKEHKKHTHKGPYVFHSNGCKIEPNSLRKKLIRIAKKNGIKDFTKLHTLRHTFASQLVMSGVDLPTVKKLMGHADIETTMIYSHLADEHIDKAVEKLVF
jgi:integrase